MKTVQRIRNMEGYASAFRQGRQTGIRYLFGAWYPSLCDYVNSLINDQSAAEEISSEAFVKTWHNRKRFRSADEIRAYLFTVAKRDAFRVLHKKSSNRKISVVHNINPELPCSPETIQTETDAIIAEAISCLPPRCRRIFELLYLEGKETGEVAKELFISPCTVRAQKARGLSLLRPRLLTVLG